MDAKVIKMNVESNLGYAADQVHARITLADLASQIEAAIEQYGEDAEVVLYQTNNAYGAAYGSLEQYGDLFTEAEAADEDDSYL